MPAWRLLSAALILLLPLPLLVVAAVSFTESRFIAFPPRGFSLALYRDFLTSPAWMHALSISLAIAALASLLAIAIALCSVVALDRMPPRIRAPAETLIMAPLTFPHAALGIAMFGFLTLTTVMKDSYAGIVLAHTILCGPFAYRPIAAAWSTLDPSLPEAAENMGATPWTVFRRVTFPLLRPGLITAAMFAFILSFDEATVTLFLVAPNVTTLPVEIYGRLESNADPVVAAISTFLIVMTLILVTILQRATGFQRLLASHDPP